MRKFLIFGGSGFVGSHLSELLFDNKEKGIVFDLEEPRNNDVEYFKCDVREIIELINGNEKDIIVNLAAIHKTPGHPDKDYFETNIRGAENVCSFARKNDIRTIVFTSSIAVYGTYEDKKSEETLPMPDIPYGISKLSAEYIHKKWQAEDPLIRRLIILRPGVVFGMYEEANFTRLINSLRSNFFAYVGRKDTKKACIYVKDLVQAIYELSINQSLRNETYNVSYNPSLPIDEIVGSVSEIGKMMFPRVLVPRRAIFFLSWIFYTIFNKKDFNPQRVKNLVVSNDINSEKINNKIKFNFGFEKGISDWMFDTDFLKKNKIY